MGQEREISFGESKKCVLALGDGTAKPTLGSELILSTYPVRGLSQGELSILVTRTAAPAIVRVEISDEGTHLQSAELEQIRKAAEGIFRGQVG